jgi:hypothetical protein
MEGVTAKPPGAGEIDQHQSININGSTSMDQHNRSSRQPQLKATQLKATSAQGNLSSRQAELKPNKKAGCSGASGWR